MKDSLIKRKKEQKTKTRKKKLCRKTPSCYHHSKDAQPVPDQWQPSQPPSLPSFIAGQDAV